MTLTPRTHTIFAPKSSRHKDFHAHTYAPSLSRAEMLPRTLLDLTRDSLRLVCSFCRISSSQSTKMCSLLDERR